LPVLDFKNQIRKKIIEIRNSVYLKETDMVLEEEERHSKELKQIYDNLKVAKPS
jgi:shikimate kinase